MAAAWLGRLAPDIDLVVRRFPLPIVLLALGAVAFVASVNTWVNPADEFTLRVVLGLWTAAVVATAGVLFAESRPDDRWGRIAMAYGLPLVVLALFQWRDTRWFIPYFLPAIALLWLSLAGSVAPRQARGAVGDRYWWLNQRAAASALVAGAAFAIVALGALAMERSLAILFGAELDALFYRYVLPVAGAFLTPVYWLATLPRLDAMPPDALERPDFLVRAVGFLGQFLLTPLLLAYGAILLAYTAQIVVLGTLPQGTIGWMVLGFTVTGAANWLLLYPAFMAERRLVRWFRRLWFWLTLVPLGLYGLAVWVRIDAYGLTPERMLLVMGGIWAGLLTLVFLVRRGDIRLIAGLAAAVLLVFSIGPWNAQNLPRWHQLERLRGALDAGYPVGGAPNWTAESGAVARGALLFLASDEAALSDVNVLLEPRGTRVEPGVLGVYEALDALSVPAERAEGPSMQLWTRDVATQPVDVGQTPVLLGSVNAWTKASATPTGLTLVLEGTRLGVGRNLAATQPGPVAAWFEMADWLAMQGETALAVPYLDFSFEGRAYRLAVDSTMVSRDDAGASTWMQLSGILFADQPSGGTP